MSVFILAPVHWPNLYSSFFYGTCALVCVFMASKPLYLGLWVTIALFHVFTKGDLDAGDLEVDSNPGLYFEEEPQDVVAIRNRPLLLNCTAGSPEAGLINITWRRDRENINDAHRYVLQNGSLFFTKIIHKKNKGRTDEGLYECVAKNDLGSIASHKIKLQVASLSRFSGEPEDSAVLEGEAAHFKCQIRGVPAPAISWEKNRQPLPLDNDRYIVLPSGVLHIQSIELSDTGKYRCQAVNIAKERHSSEATLTVSLYAGQSLPPRLLAGPVDQVKVEDETALLECVATGLPQPTVMWTKQDGAAVEIDERTSLVGEASLQIRHLQQSDSSIYVCKATISQQTVSAQANLTVMVPPRPTGTFTPPVDHHVNAATIRLPCAFSGHPPPRISWMKNGRLIEHNGRIKIKESGMLVITQSVPKDSGLYQCWGENPAGTEQVTLRLHIKPSGFAPDSPANFHARVISSSEIGFYWTAVPPTDNFSVIAYSVHYSLTKGGDEFQQVVQENSALIHYLQPYSNYTAYVVAYNARGSSGHSPDITVVTDEDVPIDAPRINVTAIGARSLRVTWTAMPEESAKGVITGHKIVYRQQDKHTERTILLPGSQLEYTITGLTPNQAYEVALLARTKVGFPDLKDTDYPWVTQQTLPPPTSGVPDPPIVHIQALNSSALLVEWNYPEGVKYAAEGFKLSYRAQGSHNNQDWTTVSITNTDRHIIGKLEAGARYEVELVAYNQRGEGESIVKTALTSSGENAPGTDREKPRPPYGVEAVPINETSIELRWQEASQSTHPSHYTISYRRLDGGTDEDVPFQYMISTSTHKVVGGLSPFTKYEFAIKTHSEKGEGDFGGEVECLTREGKPSAPLNPKWKLDGPTTVRLDWEPPAHRNGIIKAYVILYTADTDTIVSEYEWSVKKENGSVNQTRVNNLETNTLYFFKLRAATTAGKGEPTSMLKVLTRTAGSPAGAKQGPDKDHSDQEMGIIIGVCIGGGCIVVCALLIILRNRCCPPGSASSTLMAGDGPNTSQHSNGYVPNGCGHCPAHALAIDTNSHEITPMLTTLPENSEMDSKGGYLSHNGQPNGLASFNGIQAAVMANGEVRTFLVHGCQGDTPPHGAQSQRIQSMEGDANQSTTPLMVDHGSLEDIDYSLSYSDEATPPSTLAAATDSCGSLRRPPAAAAAAANTARATSPQDDDRIEHPPSQQQQQQQHQLHNQLANTCQAEQGSSSSNGGHCGTSTASADSPCSTTRQEAASPDPETVGDDNSHGDAPVWQRRPESVSSQNCQQDLQERGDAAAAAAAAAAATSHPQSSTSSATLNEQTDSPVDKRDSPARPPAAATPPPPTDSTATPAVLLLPKAASSPAGGSTQAPVGERQENNHQPVVT